MILLLFFSVTSAFQWLPKESISSNVNPFTNTYLSSKYEANIEDFPHHALVYYGHIYCSGSIINSLIIVTCAGCFFAKKEGEPTIVKVGSTSVMDRGQTYKARSIKKHEFYQRTSEIDNDIALVFLEKHIRLGKNVKKVILVEPEISLRPNYDIQITGYGSENVPQKFKNHLITTTHLVVPDSTCKAHFGAAVTKSCFCAKFLPDRLLSDNGGGATLQQFLVGVLISGGIKNEPPLLAIYTNISYFHRWIGINAKRYVEENCATRENSESEEDYDYFLDS